MYAGKGMYQIRNDHILAKRDICKVNIYIYIYIYIYINVNRTIKNNQKHIKRK